MDRAFLIVLAAIAIVIVAVVGGAIGFVIIASDPATQAQRACASGQMGPPGGCRNFRITLHTSNRVEYTYDLADGSHCIGYEEVDRRGPFGLTAGGGGGSTCAPPGQPAPTLNGPPAPPTAYPDGNPACTGAVSFAGPAQTDNGFQVTMTNTSGATCDVSGPAGVVFLDAYGQPMNVEVQAANEASAVVVLAPGAGAVYDFDAGNGPCVRPSNIAVIAASGSQQLSAPERVCEPIKTRSARPAG
jgi:hypothetical protein